MKTAREIIETYDGPHVRIMEVCGTCLLYTSFPAHRSVCRSLALLQHRQLLHRKTNKIIL